MVALQRSGTVAALGTAQTLAWASSYYLPAMLAGPMAGDLGVSTPTVFAAFSMSLIASALLGPYAGRAIDRWGGRPVLMCSSLLFALGLAALGLARDGVELFGAWLLLGLAMGGGLYEAAFSTLVRLYGHEARNSITGITLIAGFASTVGWPLSSLMELQFGWRGACFAWAGLHLLLGLPLNWRLPEVDKPAAEPTPAGMAASPTPAAVPAGAGSRHAAALLAMVFAITMFISTAMAAHLPGLLQAGGASLAAAVAVGALVGPAQVAGRLLEFGLLRRLHPLLSARLAALMHPIGAVLLAGFGAPLAAVFALLHGGGNGVLTIARGTLPLAMFGPQGYGHRQGLLAVPARFAQALAPWLFGLLLARWGAQVMWFSAGLGLMAFAALAALSANPRDQKP